MLPKLLILETPEFISDNVELFSSLFFLSAAAILGLLVYTAFKLLDALSEKAEKK
ncbi:hypothetical protein L1D14_07370 [Vibrio tubiashii]|uniref:hypothetical protein n=1 Tax=Vibrio tubiashii TaxID=29498 RepID=UPI001EFC5C42|nr:hypothetical protein [Vibrio tubiashii]MCG9576057.1 hypothetical protein [Vibrio tubiashii]